MFTTVIMHEIIRLSMMSECSTKND